MFINENANLVNLLKDAMKIYKNEIPFIIKKTASNVDNHLVRVESGVTFSQSVHELTKQFHFLNNIP